MSGFYTRHEELFHTVTHGAGAVLAAVGTLYLLREAVGDGDPWRILSVAIYGATLVLLYSASTLYHSVDHGRLKRRLRVVDHSVIYVFIAGSYTPFLLLPLRGAVGWILLAVVWALAVGGIVYKLLLLDRFPRLSTALYLAMGWTALVAAVPLARHLSGVTLAWLVAGGVVYSAGTLAYHTARRYAHTIWHLFVLAGSVCHFVAIARL